MAKRFNSVNTIQIYETNGLENIGIESDMPKMCISEHWNRREFVVIEIDGTRHTVLANELQRAIDNAQNAHAF